MPHDCLVFDLDGTLWDASKATAVAWNQVLRQEGIDWREVTADDVRAVTGMPHEECIQVSFPGLTEAQVKRVSDATMVEDSLAIERLGGELYPEVVRGLWRLCGHKKLFIVSNCQKGYIELFLMLNGLEGFFVDFECWGNTGRSKSENLRSIIDRNGLKNPVTIGDTEGDEKAARDCGVPFGFVEYGFGTAAAPDYSFDSFKALVNGLDGHWVDLDDNPIPF